MDFLVTKHGLAAAIRDDPDSFAALHALFLNRLVPVLADILSAARTDVAWGCFRGCAAA